MGAKIWRTDTEGNRGKKMLTTMVYTPFIIVLAIILTSVLVAFIAIFGDMDNSIIAQWSVPIILLTAIVLAVLLPRLMIVKAQNAKHVFARDCDGIFWYFTYSNPVFKDYYQKKHTKEDELSGISAIICKSLYKKFMLDFIRVIYFCEKVQLIEQILSSQEKVQDIFGYKVIGVEKLKVGGKKTSVKFTVDGKGNRNNTFTVDISGYQDLQGLVKELEKIKNRTY